MGFLLPTMVLSHAKCQFHNVNGKFRLGNFELKLNVKMKIATSDRVKL